MELKGKTYVSSQCNNMVRTRKLDSIERGDIDSTDSINSRFFFTHNTYIHTHTHTHIFLMQLARVSCHGLVAMRCTILHPLILTSPSPRPQTNALKLPDCSTCSLKTHRHCQNCSTCSRVSVWLRPLPAPESSQTRCSTWWGLVGMCTVLIPIGYLIWVSVMVRVSVNSYALNWF